MNWFVQQFLGDSPNSNVRVEYRHPEQVYELVERGQAQIGLVSYPRDSRHIQATAWREEEIAVACSPLHSFANRESLPLSELHGQPLVGYDERLRIWREIDKALTQAGVETNVVMRFDNTETIKRAVEIDAGIGLLPAPTLNREVAAGTLVRIPLEPPGLIRPVGIITKRGKELPVEAARFVEFLLQNSFADQAEAVKKTTASSSAAS
jgi:DNA-binding transcriptional LysR family regulator